MAEHHPLRTAALIPSDSFMQLNLEAEKLAKSCKQATVPSLNHLRMADYNLVYEPSDDTFLMLDALYNEFGGENAERLSSIRNVVEIGSGTGVSTVFLGLMLQETDNSDATLYATDINKEAIRVTCDTAKENNLVLKSLEAIQCDLATPLLQKLRNKVDVLIFNPPYVPTPEAEVGSDGIEASWAGGKDGRVVFDRAIPQIASLLSWPDGAAYIITVDDNKPEEIAKTMMEGYGIKVVPYVRRRARNEYLCVLKCTLTRDLPSQIN
jgi:release factor glutamine methyltransferase